MPKISSAMFLNSSFNSHVYIPIYAWPMHDLRLSLRFICVLLSSGTLGSVGWFGTDILGLLIGSYSWVKMEPKRSPKTSMSNQPTLPNIPEDSSIYDWHNFLSTFQNIQRRSVLWLSNNEVKWMWKEALATWLIYYTDSFSRGSGKCHRSSQ
jgi:hypothetical protein